MISKNTNRLNRSAVRKAPFRPISCSWNSGWKCTPALSQPAAENSSEAEATMAVISSIMAVRRSAAITMPKGTGQLPGR